ncbi:assembly of actin patch protein [Malassezia brasiliensis]|uniref:Assembly of actin patch protein n=1 Tax=Malassezia brasiliensis TaxID=1821822 RepID=A0AAF0DSP1_9BASI|nr:assembly of actin patch protein [Malassezia brasiliensis]
MTLPQYVQSIVKYKSPHPQDLSFQKGAYIRVLGLAERAGGDDDEEEDEEDHWYLGELLDGTKRGQFPASLVKPVDAQDISDSDVPDPSRLSLRERIAAFNKPIEKAPPPPIPRGKPGGWKRPPPPDNGQKQPVPAANEARAATGQANTSAPVGEPIRNDMPGSFSASDAKSSIKMSLKERMAALQRNEAEMKSPVAPPPRKLSRDIETEAPPEEDVDEDEKARRAAITQRMARIGGQKMGPFGGIAAPMQPPPKAAVPEAAAAPAQEDGVAPSAELSEPIEPAAQVDMPNADTGSADAPETLVIPRRTAAPRTRRPKPAASAPAPTNSETLAPDAIANPDATSPDLAPAVPVVKGSDDFTKTVGADAASEMASDTSPRATNDVDATEPQAPVHSASTEPVRSVPPAAPEQDTVRGSAAESTKTPDAPSTAASLADEFALPSAQVETTRPELLADMRAHREPYAHTAPAEEQPPAEPPSPVNVKSPVLETVPTRPAPVPEALTSNGSADSEVRPAPPVVPAPSMEASTTAPSTETEQPAVAMPSHPPPVAPAQEDIPIVPDAVPIKRAVPPPRSAPPPPMVSAAPVAGATREAPGQEVQPAAEPQPAGVESDDFVEQRHQLEQLLAEEQDTSGQKSSALPYIQEKEPGTLMQEASMLPHAPGEVPASEPQEAGQPAFTRITRVPPTPTEELAAPPVVRPERAAPVPPLMLDSKTETLSPSQGASLNRTDSTASEKNMRSAPLFAPSPSDVSFPTFASPPQRDSEELNRSEEDAEQERRAQLAQRMARIGGQRIAGIPGAPVAARPMTPPSQVVHDSVPAPQTPSAQPEAPVVPQEPKLPDVPVTATPDLAPVAHPQRPVRRAPTLPPDLQLHNDGALEPGESHVHPSRAPPSRPPPRLVFNALIIEARKYLPKAPGVNAYGIAKALRASLQQNFGDAAAGAYGGPLTCKYYSPKSGIAIVRCAREGMRYVWASATLLNEIEGQPVRICTYACGGTIRKLQRKAIAIDRYYILQLEQAQHDMAKIPPPPAVTAPDGYGDLEDDDLGMAVDAEPVEENPQGDRDMEAHEPYNAVDADETAAPPGISSATARLLEQSRADILNIS